MTSDDNWIDADIRAMKLSSGERAGLQIYRNYTRSFETDAVAKFRKALDKEPLNLEGLAKLSLIAGNPWRQPAQSFAAFEHNFPLNCNRSGFSTIIRPLEIEVTSGALF